MTQNHHGSNGQPQTKGLQRFGPLDLRPVDIETLRQMAQARSGMDVLRLAADELSNLAAHHRRLQREAAARAR